MYFLASRLLNTQLRCPGLSVKRELAGSVVVCRSSQRRGLSVALSGGLFPLTADHGSAQA